MTTAILDGPAPAPTTPFGFCLICAGTWKHAALQGPLSDAIQRAEADGRDGLMHFTIKAAVPLMAAVGYGWFLPMAPPPVGNGMMPVPAPLCWTHLMAMDLRAGGVIPATASQMPGLSGAVMLDQRR